VNVVTLSSLLLLQLHFGFGGPPEKSIIYALLFFSMLGTGTFSIEIINVWLEIFRNNPLILQNGMDFFLSVKLQFEIGQIFCEYKIIKIN
jgi:hypothetical protein